MTTNAINVPSLMSFFGHASGTVVNGGTFTSNSPASGGTLVQQSNSVVIKRRRSKRVNPNFLSAVAPHAFQNAVGQLELSRCFPGTRLKVMDDIENWINSTGGSNYYQGHIAWLTGPAGCGKSATVQTLSERCSDQQIPVANFFFLRDDTTRNHIQPLVASLAYQLSRSPGFPGAEDRANQFITSAIDTHPLIFRQSIENQFLHLIIALTRHVQPGKPVVLLIDGLDECASEADQQILIRVIHELVAERNPSVSLKILFASRPEAHLAMSFNQLDQSAGGLLKLSLDDERYHPGADIRAFVLASFDGIKRTHRLGTNLGSVWPSDDAIDQIVSKSSGQFLYAATVMQFIANSFTSPADKLATVITPSSLYSLQPLLQQTDNPFAHMDVIFTHVFSRCAEADWATLSNILAAQIILHGIGDANYNLDDCLAPLDIDTAVIDALISGLLSVVQYDGDKKRVLFHHASLPDFLVHKARAQKHHIDINSFAAQLVGKIVQKADITKRSSTFKFMSSVLRNVLEPTPDLISALRCCPSITYPLYDDNDPDLHQSFFIILLSIRFLYFHREKHKKDVYKSLLRTWLKWSLPHFGDHFDIISQGMESHGITPSQDIRLMIQEKNGQKGSRRAPLRLLSNFFWPGDYDRDSAKAAYKGYLDSKDVASLNAATRNFELAVEQYREHKNPSLAITLVNYAIAVWRRYNDVSRSAEDLDKVIRLDTEARRKWSGKKNTELYLFLLGALAGAYLEQYRRAFELCPIKPEEKQKAFYKAVEHYIELKDNPAAGSQRSATQVQLGIIYHMRCLREQTLDCFEIGVQHLQDALFEATEAGKEIDAGYESDEAKQGEKVAVDDIKATCLLNLANSYEARYALVKDPRNLHDLTMAIDSNTRAKPLLEVLNRPELPACMFNIARQLKSRWLQTKHPRDLMTAIKMADAARDIVNDNDPLKQDIDQLMEDLQPERRRETVNDMYLGNQFRSRGSIYKDDYSPKTPQSQGTVYKFDMELLPSGPLYDSSIVVGTGLPTLSAPP